MDSAFSLFFLGLLLASLPLVAGALVLSALTGSPVWAALGLAACLALQAFASISIRRGSTRALGSLLGLSYHVLRLTLSRAARSALTAERMVVAVNNAGLSRRLGSIPADARVLLLLPHCLQQHECGFRIVFDPFRCARCGACDFAGILDLAEEFGAEVAVATGGTIARKAVEKASPDIVMAVACPRDLCSGILDTTRIPVWGILNSWPSGECFDTRVDVGGIRKVLEAIRKRPV